MEGVHREEKGAEESGGTLFEELEEESEDEDGIERVKEEIIEVKEEGVEPRERVLDLVREECEGNVELGIEGPEDTWRELPHERVLEDELRIIEADEIVPEDAPVCHEDGSGDAADAEENLHASIDKNAVHAEEYTHEKEQELPALLDMPLSVRRVLSCAGNPAHGWSSL